MKEFWKTLKMIIELIILAVLAVAMYFGIVYLFVKSICVTFGMKFDSWYAVFASFLIVILAVACGKFSE